MTRREMNEATEKELLEQEARRAAKNIVNSTDNLYESVEAARRLQKIYRRATEILEDFPESINKEA